MSQLPLCVSFPFLYSFAIGSLGLMMIRWFREGKDIGILDSLDISKIRN